MLLEILHVNHKNKKDPISETYVEWFSLLVLMNGRFCS